jgi:sulfide:quinone oxidoreductase
MTELKKLTDDIYVSAQITETDFAELSKLGVTSIICNRPDGEDLGQPSFEQIKQWAARNGMTAEHNSLVSGQLSPEHIELQGAFFNNTDGKKLAYCRSGMRSTTLWALSQKGRLTGAEILETAANAGYDLSPMAGMFG